MIIVLKDIQKWIGLAGVAQSEPKKVQKIGKAFEYMMLLMIFLLIYQWRLSVESELSQIINWIVWGFFVVETTILLCLVQNKKLYLKTNWMNLIFIGAGILVIWNYTPLLVIMRFLRPMLLIILILPWIPIFVKWLSDTSLLTTLSAYFVVVIFFGLLASAIDPVFKSPFEGIWWALVTISTLGYGDIVPFTPYGKMLTACLLIFGLCFFAVLTANFSAIFMRKNMMEELALLRDSHKNVEQILKSYDVILEDEKKIMENIDSAREEEFRILLSLQTVKEEEETIISILQDLHMKINNIQAKLDK